MTKRTPKSEAIEKPYGWVLVLRGLARAAIMLSDHPAALRVLCVASQYMNQDGECRLGQDTIAAHLGITRQAANKHLALLDGLEILISHKVKDGILKTYYLNTDDLEDGRAGQKRVDERRAAKRAAKRRAAKKQSDESESEKPEGPDEIAARQADGIYLIHERIGWKAFGDAELAGGDVDQCFAAMEVAEKVAGVAYSETERVRGCRAFRRTYVTRPPLTIVPQDEPPRPFAVNERVGHTKFGVGTVLSIDGNKLTVAFEKAGKKKVVDSFVERCAS